MVDGAKLFHLLFIKTNERMGGYVDHICVENVKSGKIDQGILGIETDVLYQWRNLVQTFEKRLTPIKNVFLDNVQATEVKFISRILGQKELPIQNVRLKSVKATKVIDQPSIHENVTNFKSE